MARHPYRRLRSARFALPEVGISEHGNIRSLHLGSETVQSSMNVDYPAELVLSYSRAMMAWLLFAESGWAAARLCAGSMPTCPKWRKRRWKSTRR